MKVIKDEESTVMQEKKRKHTGVIWLFIVIALMLVIEGTLEFTVLKRTTSTPATSNQQSTTVLPFPKVPTGPGVPAALNMAMPGAPISISSFQAPQTAPVVKRFTLTAEAAHIVLSAGVSINGWTFADYASASAAALAVS